VVSCFHAITRQAQPEREICYFKLIAPRYDTTAAFFCGDFNCPQSNDVFNPLKKQGYQPSLTCQKTSLKQKMKDGECLASEYDNIFYNSAKVQVLHSGVIEFHRSFSDLATARKISDHLPVFLEFNLR
jgi:deoxyribonuclease-1-like protein